MTTYTNFLKLRAQAYDQQNWDVLMNENLAIIDFNAGALNSKNRVALGGVVSAGTGLNADYTAMVVEVGGTIYNIAAGSIACTASALNYLYVNASGTVMASTAAPTGDYVPLAVVDTSATVLLRVGDLRQIDILSRVRAWSGTIQTMAAGGWTKVLFQNKNIDALSEYDAQASRFTALVAGRYAVSSMLTWKGNTVVGEQHVLAVFVNGSQRSRLDNQLIGEPGSTASSGQTSIDLVAGQYIEIYAYTTHARDSWTGSPAVYVTITRLI